MYMLRPSLWDKICSLHVYQGHIIPTIQQSFLCITCVEQAINRKLDIHDFDCMPINLMSSLQSDLLKSRLAGFKETYAIPSIRNSYDICITQEMTPTEAINYLIENYGMYVSDIPKILKPS